jgi:NDP-sugar pyrophosphorylase family protein
MSLSLVILAAGVGSRYGGLKQLEPVGPGGESLMEYSIFDAERAGFERVVLVVRPETDHEFRSSIGERIAGRLPVAYVHQTLDDVPEGYRPPPERAKPWGTGHAVLAAEAEVDGPFAVINADDFYGADSFAVLGSFLRETPDGGMPTFAMAGFAVGPTLSESGPVSRGLCRVDDEAWLEGIVEILKLSKRGDGGRYTDVDGRERAVASQDPVSMNMWGFTTALFEALRRRFSDFLESSGGAPDSEFLLPDVVQRMIRDGSARVRVLRHGSRWCGITYPEDRVRAEEMIAELVARGVYPPRLWE